MLQSLTIKNIALINDLTIDLGTGLNVLTGETGAGKSLIIDSLALLLGEKADKSLISYGENFASVEAVFETTLPEVLDKLEEFGLERENTIIIYRKLSSDGKNECRVNGKSFTLSMLKAITAPLMDLHGQFQHQELLKVNNQLRVLDDFGGLEINNAKKEYQEVYKKLKQVCKELASYNFDSRDKERLLDLYSFQINEIEEAHFVDGEEESLKEFRVKVLNQEKILSSLEKISNIFDGSGEGFGLIDIIKKCDYEMQEILKYLPEQEDLSKRLSSARYELEDISDSLDSFRRDFYMDENAAAENEKRLDLLSLFKKKYGSNIAEINEYLKNIKVEYDKLISSSEVVEKLEAEKQKLTEVIESKAAKLTELRKKYADIFAKKVKEELSALSMKNADFEIEFSDNRLSFDESGFDTIEFMFTANAGQPLKPLSKVASGGEMSRFMLAVKNITADIVLVDTMIFDEIDTGISGDTANVLAEKLAKIGKAHQVICVTHLAQVASFGTTHFVIKKEVVDGKTKTFLNELSFDDRVEEIARLIGGSVSSFSREHAKLMLDSGKNYNS